MIDNLEVMCIGACGWDIVGNSNTRIAPGEDVPGEVNMTPGGVSYNIHHELTQLGIRSHMATAIGHDPPGTLLVNELQRSLNEPGFIIRKDLPTALYAAIEDNEGVVGAVSNSKIVEIATTELLQQTDMNWQRNCTGTYMTVVDGNISEHGMHLLRSMNLFEGTRLIIVSASPRKAPRLKALAGKRGMTLYLNRLEASVVCSRTRPFPDAQTASCELLAKGFDRVIVTDGARPVSDRCASIHVTANPGTTRPELLTGSGDRLLARHIYYEFMTNDRLSALHLACDGDLPEHRPLV